MLKPNPGYGISEAIKEISSVSGSSFTLLQPVVSGMDILEKETSGITIIKTNPLGNNQAITENFSLISTYKINLYPIYMGKLGILDNPKQLKYLHIPLSN